jgi:hypothetical protein
MNTKIFESYKIQPEKIYLVFCNGQGIGPDRTIKGFVQLVP